MTDFPRRQVRFAGTGAYVPEASLLSVDIDRTMGRKPGFVETLTKVSRRPVAEGTDQIDMGLAAARAAMDAAGLGGKDIDLVLFAAAVPYQTIPATAPLLQRELAIPSGRAAAFDINSTCLSFLTASDLAATLIAGGQYRHALVISSEIASRALPWEKAPLTAALFGDGAGAAVLAAASPGDSAHIAASLMETYPDGFEACRLGSGGTRYDYHRDPQAFAENSLFEMDGKALYRLTFSYFEGFLDRLLARAGWSRADVDVILPHQASATALSHLVDQCGFDRSRVVDIMETHGNQIAASLPSVLHHAWCDQRLKPGTKALMIGTSAGLSLGGMAFVA